MGSRQRSTADLAEIRELVRLRANEHGGAFRRSDLDGWRVPDGVVPSMLRRGWWTRLHHGVYADSRLLDDDAESPAGHLLQCAASLKALPGPAYAFGPTAALVHGLPQQRGILSDVHLIRPIDRDGRALRRRITAPDHLEPARIRAHHLTPEDVVVVNGIPTVRRALAALSTAAMSGREWAVATLDAAAWQQPSVPDELAAMAAQWSHLRGIGTVRSVLPLVRCGAQTPLESLSRIRLIQCGVPEPELQSPVHDRDGLIGYVDMLWESLGVVGEADGLIKYATREDLVNEKRREDRIRAAGYSVVRWTWREIMADPADVAQRVVQAAARRSFRTA
jgi:hypothetical protein